MDTTLFFAPHSGGVRRYLLAKHRYLARQSGVRHSLVVPAARDGTAGSGIVGLRSTPVPGADGCRFPLRVRAWSRAIAELSPDVVEAGDPYTPAWAALRAAEARHVPAVLFAHSDLVRLVAARFGALAGAAARRYVAGLLSRFDLVMAPSFTVAGDLAEMGLARVVVQPLGVDVDRFHPGRRTGTLRAELGLPAETRLLVFAGRDTREKRVELLKRAVAGLGPPYHLLLVGGRSRGRLGPCVTALPFQQDEAHMATLLASADALVHAGDRETFGLVVLEAMACGRPAVVVDRGALRELVDESVGQVARANDARSLQEAIEELYRRDIDSLGQRARARVQRSFAWDRVLRAQLARYEMLAGRRRAAPVELGQVPEAL